ncbi:MAG: sorbosone dehydrogenase [Gammaproteobacteria bacterium HGW-Gammaproteobacteria-3]|nr:MAG: sorbosone dehydrogenase [Gammaproteobacteria bacterium HGW-Gammaproteobacteria-3]
MKIKLFGLFLLQTALTVQAENYQAILKQLQLPVGFSITVFADQVPNARSLALGDRGVIFIGTRQQGDVYAVRDSNGDGVADQRYVIASKLYMPNGVAYKDGALYVAEVNRILRFDNIIDHLAKPPKPVVIYDRFPGDKWHGWKYLRFGPDGKLYTAVGAPCNICEPEQEIYTSLVRMNADGSDFEILARGIRNTVGFDWQPGSQALFFTENGRDYLGDDAPPDELNLWTEKGQHFGYPYCHGGTIPDPELSKVKNCDAFAAPAWKFKAHKAPLGLRFYQGGQFPANYKNQLLVAQHGSWNRSKPHGYQIARVNFKNGQAVSEHTFISGWLTADDKVLGRPVDILTLPDGSLLISDDKLGVVYKVEYKP